MVPDMSTVLYKILKYADSCMKSDVEPDLEEARKLAGVNNTYFTQVMIEADRKGLISGLYIPERLDTREPCVIAQHMAITLDGAQYLEENSSMRKVASMLGDAARAAIDSAVSATMKASLGF